MKASRTLLASALAAAPLLVATPAASARDDSGAAPLMYVDCGHEAEFGANGVRMRAQPNTSSRINGLGYDGQDVWVHRVVLGEPINGIRGWADSTNLVTGVRGYVSYVHLDCR